MLRKAGISIRENVAALPEYFLYRCVMPPNTLYQDIFQIMLGGSLDVSFNRSDLRVAHHYFVPAEQVPNHTLFDTAEHIRSRIIDVLKANTTIQSKILLSGGIDSSLVFKLAQKSVGVQHSYSSAYPFEKSELDVERNYAMTAAESFGSIHEQFVPSTSRYLEAVIQSIADAELPLHHLQSPLMYLFCKDCFSGTREPVVNSIGAGGVFGNFRSFLYHRRRPSFRLLNNSFGRSILRITRRLTGHGHYRLELMRDANGSNCPPSENDSIWQWHAYGSYAWIKKRLGADWPSIIAGPANIVNHYYSKSIEDIWALYSLLGDETATINIWSKLAEACHQTMLFPMYDEDVLKAGFQLSWNEKLAPPENRLRKAIAELSDVPSHFINRPKSGFGVQRLDWAIKGGPLDPLIAVAAEAVDIDWIKELQREDRKMAMTFWNLINYGIWKRICINGESPEDLIEELRSENSDMSGSVENVNRIRES